IALPSGTVGTGIPSGNPVNGGIAITPDGTLAFVVNTDTDVVTAFNLVTKVAQKVISVGDGPVGVAISPNAKTAYVPNGNDASVTPTAIATLTAGTAIPLGNGNADGIAITPDQAPVAQLGVTPAAAGSATQFSAAGSTVLYGTIKKYVWKFGDGATAHTTT